MGSLGRTVGSFYALSTIGSVIGTALTGFVLIAYFGVSTIFFGIGTILLLLGMGHFVIFRRRFAALSLLFLPLLGLIHDPAKARTLVMENGTQVTRIAEVDSFYGSLKVLDYRGGTNHTREMVIDGLIQGGIDMRDGLSIYEYPYFLQLIPRAIVPHGQSALVIGVGAGILPRWYERQGVATEAVDIDPEVVKLARDYFGFDFKGPVHIEDARYFLNRSDKRYDYLLLDVFSGDITPGYLLSREAVALFHDHISEQGALAINLVGSLRRDPLMTASVVETLRSRFEQVELYPTFDPAEGDGSGNIVVMAYDGEPRTVDWQAIDHGKISSFARVGVAQNLGRRFQFPEGTEALVLSDDYNPIDFYDSWLRESVRRDILASTRLEMLF
jgi:spermidine synthase